MANITWDLTKSDTHDSWEYYADRKKPKKSNKENEKKLLIKELTQIINNNISKISQNIDIEKVVQKVIDRTKDHEIRQTTHIKKNSQNIDELNKINIWGKYN